MPLKRPGTVLIIMCRTVKVADECAGSMLYWSAASADAANASANAMMPVLRYRIDFCSLNCVWIGLRELPVRYRKNFTPSALAGEVQGPFTSMVGGTCLTNLAFEPTL